MEWEKFVESEQEGDVPAYGFVVAAAVKRSS